MQVEAIFKANQYKGYRSFKDLSITIKETPFTVTLNNNKRMLIFNKGVLIATKNITVLNNKILSNNNSI